MRAADFFAFARARHQIYLDRQAGRPEPWTDDPILGRFRFTNVFRELDRTTLWFRGHVRERLAGMDERTQLLGTILFREIIFNQERLDNRSPAAWSYLGDGIDVGELEAYMRAHCPAPWVTGAYIVKTPDGMDKLRGALWIVEAARIRVRDTVDAPYVDRTLESVHRALLAYPYLGGFTAYEIVSDLRHLPVLRHAQDIMTWAHAGPGAIRGLNRLRETDTRAPIRQDVACATMETILARSRDPDMWPPGWPTWEMREVEHTLCEFDKYERVRLGEGTPRGRFR
jgi:hypothetical protein